jgi:amino acid adenylation domain-containing protein
MSDLSQRLASLSPEKRALLERRLLQSAGGEKPAAPIPRVEDGHPPVASLGQERLWLIEQIEGGTPTYNIALGLRLGGPLNETALRAALNHVAARHETLRTRFLGQDGRLRIEIAERPAVDLPVIECTGESLAEASEREARHVFQLDRELPFRAALFRIGSLDHELLLNLHHMVSDGWSTGVLLRELTLFYNAEAAGRAAGLPDLPVCYSDYAQWQRDTLVGSELERLTSYWTEHLSGSSFALQIPTNRPRPQLQTFRGAKQILDMPAEVAQPMKDFCRRENVTPFMVLLATLYAVLHRYSGQQDIVVGSPVAARTRVELEGLIGFFTNTLALRGDLSGNPSFHELVQRVRNTSLGAFEHQEMPLEKLIEALNPERDLSRTPLFQVVFAFQNAPFHPLQLEGVEASLRGIHTATAKFDLTLFMQEDPEGLTASIEYNTDLFDPPAVTRLWNHFRRLLANGLAHPEQPVGSLPMLSEEERREVLEAWNPPLTGYPRDIPLAQLVEAQVERTPDAVALVFEDSSLTYHELNERANQLAHELRKHGAGPDQLVGACMERSIDLVVALLAIIKAGAAYVPIDPWQPAGRVGYMIEDSGLRILLTQRELRSSLPPFAGTIIEVDGGQWQTNSRENPAVAVTADHLAYVIYTSGSTGHPKGVQIPRGALTNILWCMRDWLQSKSGETLLAVTTISFDIAGIDVWLPLLVGARSVIANRAVAADGQRLQETIERYQVKFLQATPVTWRLLLAAGWQGKPDLTTVCTGEAMPRELAAQLHPRVGRLWNLYGPTETTIWSTGFLVEKGDGPVLIGRPVANTQCYILDGLRNPVPAGVTGELYIAGDGLARGYLNRPELTEEKFVANPFVPGKRMYRTGDLARHLPDGNIECLGRTDHQVKIRGFRIELEEIETALRQHPAVNQAVVVAREDAPGDKRLTAYLTCSGDTAPDRGELRALLKQALPDYMIPADYVALDALPISPNGKIDRNALPRPTPMTGQSESKLASEPPRNEIERKLVEIFRQVLGVESVGIEDDFFDLGGHSLAAVQAILRIKTEFGVEAPVRPVDLMRSPTPRGLALLISSNSDSPDRIEAIQLRSGSDGAPVFWIPGGDGLSIISYQAISALLEGRAVYGLVASSDRTCSRLKVEEKAARYIEAIRQVSPKGPYHLLGYCAGSWLAYEMARQLSAAGEPAGATVIGDVPVPGYLSPVAGAFAFFLAGAHHAAIALRLAGPARKQYIEDTVKAYYWDWLAQHRRWKTPLDQLTTFDRANMWVRATAMTYAKSLGSLDHTPDLDVIIAGLSPRSGLGVRLDARYGWARLGRQTRFHEIFGSHVSLLNHPHNVRLAATLLDIIKRAEDSLVSDAGAPVGQ